MKVYVKNSLIVIILVIVIMTGCSQKGYSYVNLDHLNFLNEIVEIDGEEMLITHIYASPLGEDYIWIDADGEGISCIDDVARAVIVYLKDYNITKNEQSLKYARAGLNFILYMQQENGHFYNFIYNDYSINKEGITSYESISWWAARGLWALAYGYETFADSDQEYASKLEEAILLTNNAITKEIDQSYGSYVIVAENKYPAWLMNNGTDVSGIYLDALSKYYELTKNDLVVDNIEKLAEGIILCQQGSFDEFPWGMINSYVPDNNMWHEWGAHQVHALANAGRILGRKAWIEKAKEVADGFLVHMFLTNRVYQINPNPEPYEQIAYGTNMYIQSFISLYKATKDDKYLKLAGITGGWFLGDNVANEPLYNRDKGYGYDGIDGLPIRINYNAGAESTIEALWALIDIESYKTSKKYLNYTNRVDINIMQYVEAEEYCGSQGDIKEIYGGNEYSNKEGVAIQNGGYIELEFEVINQEYVLYLSAEKNKLTNKSTKVDITIDDNFIGEIDLSGQYENRVIIETLGEITLSEGTHKIVIKSTGIDEKSYAKIDAIYVYPKQASVTWENEDGKKITVIRDIDEKDVYLK